MSTGIAKFSADELKNIYPRISATDNYTVPPFAGCFGLEPPEFSNLQVFDDLKSIRKTAAGHDGVPYWAFQEIAHNFANVVTAVFKKDICLPEFPHILKVAPLHADSQS